MFGTFLMFLDVCSYIFSLQFGLVLLLLISSTLDMAGTEVGCWLGWLALATTGCHTPAAS